MVISKITVERLVTLITRKLHTPAVATFILILHWQDARNGPLRQEHAIVVIQREASAVVIVQLLQPAKGSIDHPAGIACGSSVILSRDPRHFSGVIVCISNLHIPRIRDLSQLSRLVILITQREVSTDAVECAHFRR